MRRDFTMNSIYLSRNGDLVQEMYLRLVSGADPTATPDIRTEDCSNIINTVELEIGGQKVDKHYSLHQCLPLQKYVQYDLHTE